MTATRNLNVPKLKKTCKMFKQKLIKYSPLVLSVAMLILFGAGEVNAACHVVTPTGSGTKSGADWSNAMADLPSTLIRGDSYYLGPGVYSEFNHNEATNN